MGYKYNYWCFIILCFVGGFIGLQEFYREKTGLGIFAVIFFWTGIPSIVGYIEGLVWLFKGESRFIDKYCL